MFVHTCGKGSAKYNVDILNSGEFAKRLVVNSARTLLNEASWSQAPHTEASAAIIFAVVLRVAAVACYDLLLPFNGYPYKLVELLYPSEATPENEAIWQESALQFLTLSPCCLDAFSLHFRGLFREITDLRGATCQQMLHALCQQLDGSTYSTEKLHSLNSRRICARSSTHQMSLPQAAVFHMEAIPQGCRQFHGFHACHGHPQQHQKRALPQQDSGRGVKKRRGGGGGWRAFVHRQGQGEGSANFKDLASQYRRLSPENRAAYQELGRQASAVHRHHPGTRAFPLTHKTALKKSEPKVKVGPTFKDVLTGAKIYLIISMHYPPKPKVI